MVTNANTVLSSGPITLDKDGFLNIAHFAYWIDISKVAFYNIKITKNGKLKIKFYDKKRKLVRPYGSSRPKR